MIRFDYRGVPERWRGQRTWWLVLDRGDVDLCLTDPRFGTDIVVSADIVAMGQVWTGHLTFAQAIRVGGIRIEGPRPLVHALPSWFLLSPYAPVKRVPQTG